MDGGSVFRARDARRRVLAAPGEASRGEAARTFPRARFAFVHLPRVIACARPHLITSQRFVTRARVRFVHLSPASLTCPRRALPGRPSMTPPPLTGRGKLDGESIPGRAPRPARSHAAVHAQTDVHPLSRRHLGLRLLLFDPPRPLIHGDRGGREIFYRPSSGRDGRRSAPSPPGRTTGTTRTPRSTRGSRTVSAAATAATYSASPAATTTRLNGEVARGTPPCPRRART